MSLYKLLGIKKNASDQEITSAYRKLALQLHPDRNPEGAEQFKKVNEAYCVLSDPVKRASFDQTGVIPGSEATPEEDEAQRSAGIAQEVAEFYKIYRNSPEEEADVVKAYEAAKGALDTMLQDHLLFDNGVDGEVVRIAGIVKSLLEKGAIKPLKNWKKTSAPDRVKKLVEAMEEERQEAEKAIEKLHGDAKFKVPGKEGSLQELIVARSKDRAAGWNSFLDDMEAKYSAGKKKGATAEPTKKKARKE